MHWADVLAAKVAPRAEKHVLATAITPSGPIHVGNMREVLTTEMVYRSLRDVEKLPSELVYIADTYDPLRKVYPFLDPKVYQDHVGRPLREIPCPCDEHSDYAQHFLEPFFASLRDLGVDMTVLDAHQMYQEGKYKSAIEDSMGAVERLRGIIESVSKRKLPPDWIPFNIQCESCLRITTTKPVTMPGADVSLDGFTVYYRCACGHEGHRDVTQGGAGKLPWRVDWPARWRFLGVTFEAMGKDHAAAGSSWDTGVRIAEDVFGTPAPERTVYEFVQIKGAGAMHSSTGTAVSAEDMLRMTPPEVLRFFIARSQPNKHLDFDPAMGLLEVVDAFDEWEQVHHGVAEAKAGMKDVGRVYELSMPREVPQSLPKNVTVRHLVTVVQLARDVDDVLRILQRNDDLPASIADEERSRLEHRVSHVRYWLENFAPDEVKFEVQPDVPSIPFSQEEQDILREALKRLKTADWKAQEIHNALHESAQDLGHKPRVAFGAVYKAFLGQERGPRAGYFLAQLGKAFVLKRLEAAGGVESPMAREPE